MKKTRSELRKEISKNSEVTDHAELESGKKRKKQAPTASNPPTDSKSKEIAKIKTWEDVILNIYNEIKPRTAKYEVKPEVLKKEVEIESDRFKKIKTISNFQVVTQMELFYKHKYQEHNKIADSEDICSICQYTFYENLLSKSIDNILEEDKKEDNHVILLENCSDHYFHSECLEMMIGDKTSIKCPNCNKIYGIMTGDMPPGTMSVKILKGYKCSGFKCDTIEMSYNFPNGTGYTGTSRVGYLPNNQEGKEILGMFKVAYDRRLLFTIGTSVTTGATNTTVFNGIHFKTNMDGGPAYFGYPDPTYFNRVKQEFAAKGVLPENIPEKLEDIADKLLSAKPSVGRKKR